MTTWQTTVEEKLDFPILFLPITAKPQKS